MKLSFDKRKMQPFDALSGHDIGKHIIFTHHGKLRYKRLIGVISQNPDPDNNPPYLPVVDIAWAYPDAVPLKDIIGVTLEQFEDLFIMEERSNVIHNTESRGL